MTMHLPPAAFQAMSDPELSPSAFRLYFWLLNVLDTGQPRPVKLSAIPIMHANTATKAIALLVNRGYIAHHPRPAHEMQHYRIYSSRFHKNAA